MKHQYDGVGRESNKISNCFVQKSKMALGDFISSPWDKMII